LPSSRAASRRLVVDDAIAREVEQHQPPLHDIAQALGIDHAAGLVGERHMQG
jgi:hypothetical protein